MTETFDAPSNGLTDMVSDLLVRNQSVFAERRGPGALIGAFGVGDGAKDFASEEPLESSLPDPNQSAFARMFSSKFGSEAAAAIGNESRTLAAINHLSTELIAESLRLTDQIQPDDRVLLSSVRDPVGLDPKPVVIVLSDWERIETGEVRSDTLDLNPDMMQSVLLRSGSEALGSRSSDVYSPERAVLEQALRAEVPVLEVMGITRPEIVSFPKPKMVPLCAPIPGLRVVKGNEVSTSGILCRDEMGRLGITACHHGTGPMGTPVEINGVPHTVGLADQTQDLVFIPVDDSFLMLPRRAQAGLRQEDDLVPATNEKFRFDGIMNPDTETLAQSSDPHLFNLNPLVQMRMQTTRDTDKGDSGSALIDRNNKLVGFAFFMTAFNSRPAFTDWIWAPNALQSLGLTPV